eukprot:5900456-Amphidinium_carterae.1
MGAKTGRGTGFDTEFKYVIKNTLDPQKEELRRALHSLAGLHPQNISYTSMVVTKLHAGQEVGPHRDVKNDDSVPNHTICFGDYGGGLFQVMRQTENGSDAWEIIGLAKTWVSFYAKSLRHKVSEVTKGCRYSVTFYTPGRLNTIPAGDWRCLRDHGFPVDEVIARLQFFGMEFPTDVVPVSRNPEVSDTTSDQKPSTVSFGAVSSSSRKPEESTPIREEVEIKYASEIKKGKGSYLCGQEEGGSRCHMCKNVACCLHLRVKIDQKTNQALPICRSCSLTDETSRKVGLEPLPVKVPHLVEGVKAMSNLCAGTKEHSSGPVKSYQQVLSERLGVSTDEDSAPEEVLARAALTIYEIMSILEKTELTNHLPYAMVRIHHLQQALQGVNVGDMGPLVMSSPELIKIMHA